MKKNCVIYTLLLLLWGNSSVLCAAPIVNDCNTAIVLPVNTVCNFNKFLYPTSNPNVVPSVSCLSILGQTVRTRIWYKFTATSNLIQLTAKTTKNNVYWNRSGYNILEGSCGALISKQCDVITAQSNILVRSINNLTIGNDYYLLLGFGGFADSISICLTPGQVAIPQTMISTRKGGNWDNPSTWLAGRAPINGDTVVINDSAKVTVLGGLPINIPFLTVGRGITNDSAKLLNWYNLTVSKKLTVLRAQDRILGQINVNQDVVYNSNANNDYDKVLSIYYLGNGNKTLTRTAPMDTAFLEHYLRCNNCTLNVDFELKIKGNLIIDSGAMNCTQGVAFYKQSSRNQIYITSKGKYLGPIVKAGPKSLNYKYTGLKMKTTDTLTVGNEWPALQFVLIEVEDVTNLKVKYDVQSFLGIQLKNSYVHWPKDTLRLMAGFTTTQANLDTTKRLAVSGSTILGNRSGLNFSMGQVSAFRSMSFFNIGTSSNNNVQATLVGARPSKINASYVAPLSQLAGSRVVRIQAPTLDSIQVQFYRNVSDSLDYPLGFVYVAQAPSMNGPWKTITKSDTTKYNSHIKIAKVKLADGEYFSYALGFSKPKLARLNRVYWPSNYTAGCPTSVFVPVSFAITNEGSQPLDSIELGYSTPSEYKVARVAINPPLGLFKRDTITLLGPDGMNLSNLPPTFTAKGFIGYPNLGRTEDTIKTAINYRPNNLPWQEDFPYVNTDFRFICSNKLPLVAGWHFDYSAPWDNYRQTNAYYEIVRKANNTNGFLICNARYTKFEVVTKPIAITTGTYYFNAGLWADTTYRPNFDTLRLEFTLDCGQTWKLITKKRLTDVPINRTTNYQDSIQITQAGNIAIRFSRPSDWSIPDVYIDYLKLSSQPTALPNAMANNQNMLWYPNPSTGLFYSTTDQPQEVMVFNSLGVLVKKQTVLPDQTLDLGGLPKGIYLVKGNGGVCRVVRE